MKKMKFAILLISFRSMLHMALSSIIAPLTQAFPDASLTTVQQIMSLPSLAGIPATLLAGILMTKVRKKPLALFFLALSVLVALPLFIHTSLPFLLVMAVVIGLSNGTTAVITALIAEQFDGPERSSMLGLKTGISEIGIVVFSLLGGLLAAGNWYNLYGLFLIGIPVLIVAAVCLPKGEKPAPIAKTQAKEGGSRNTSIAVIYILLTGVFYIALFSFSVNNSLLLSERGYSSTALAGAATAAMAGGGGVFGLLHGKLSKWLGPFVLPLGAIVPLVGFTVFSFTDNLVLYFIGAASIGAAMAIMHPATLAVCAAAVPKSAVSFVSSLVLVFQGLGTALCPTVVSAAAGWFNITIATQKMIIPLAIMVVLLAVHLGLAFYRSASAKKVAA